MKRSQVLKEEREALQTELDELVNKGGEYTEQENNRTVELAELIQTKSTEIDQAEAEEKAALIRAAARQKAKGGGEDREVSGMKKRFSISRAIRLHEKGREADGIEGEAEAIAKEEFKRCGIAFPDGVMIPARFIQPIQPEWRTTLETGVAATAGNQIDTDLDGVIPIFRPKMQMLALGAEYKHQTSANYSFVRQTAAPTFAFKAEKAAAAETNPTTEKVNMTPKILSGYIPVTIEMLMQDALGLDSDLMRDINLGTAQAGDYGFFNADGLSDDPTGLLNISGINSVAIGANGGAPTRDHLISMWKELAQDNVPDAAAISYLTNPTIVSKLLRTIFDAGSGQSIIGNDRMFMGYKVNDTTQLPTDLVKGTSSDCSPIILGDWSKALVVQWAGIVIIKDQYTQAKNGIVNYIAHSWWDFNVRKKEAFVAIKDARDV